jgi:hypothetical protein
MIELIFLRNVQNIDVFGSLVAVLVGLSWLSYTGCGALI